MPWRQQYLFLASSTYVALLLLGQKVTAQVFVQEPINVPEPSFLNPCWAGLACFHMNTVFSNLYDALFISIAPICLAIFLIGAYLMVISAGRDTLLQTGKSMMIGSLIGLAINVGAYAIYRTVIYLIYPG